MRKSKVLPHTGQNGHHLKRPQITNAGEIVEEKGMLVGM